MIRGKRQVYHGVLDIPEGKAGKFEVRYMREPAGKVFYLATARTAILGGDARRAIQYDGPTRWHELLEKGRRWMTDLPIEQAQHDRELRPMRGTVLVGGLGLGYAATVLAIRRSVTRVVVVEKAPEVIRLVGPHLYLSTRGKVEVVRADLFEYLKETTEQFAWGFFDIWTHDGEGTFFEVVCPLRKLADGKVRRLVCWNENVMRGQLAFSLQNRLWYLENKFQSPEGPPVTLDDFCQEKGNIWHDWMVSFFRWVRDRKPGKALLEKEMQTYAATYGLNGQWETL